MTITIQNISPDLSLKEIVPNLESLDRLKKLRDDHFRKGPEFNPEICIELSCLMTNFLKELVDRDEAHGDSPALRAGKMYKYILENKTAVFHDENLLAGTTTSKRKGVLLHPDMYALAIWPELETISNRPKNPFRILKEDIEDLTINIFPYWMDKTIFERARSEYDDPECQRLMERIIFFLASKATAIGHTIPNYAAVVEKGFRKIKEEFLKAEENERKSTNCRDKIDFYQGVQCALEGIMTYARNLSEKAKSLSKENDDEFDKMSQVCAWIAAEKPNSFREAVNAVWICHVALHQETINFGLSPGRLDQVLYEPFKNNLEQSRKEGREEEFLKEAIELVGCLWLKICDHVPLAPEASEEIFGGTGANQAVTLGGVDQQGNDAVNDLTYVMLRVTELLRVRDPNVNARYFPGVNSKEYLQRLCQVNVETKATPCFHNDKAVIETLIETYKDQQISEEHARDYGSVGCVEPESCGRTFGHPGALALNLPAVLELTLFQGKHRMYGINKEDEQISPPQITKTPEEMTSFEEFKQAFKTRLEWLMDQAVTLNNNLGRVYEKHHPFPMLSAFMEGCLEQGKDVIQGGAKYNSSGFWIIGLAEVVDSLTAIEKFVFDQTNPHRISFREMMEAINQNWTDLKLQTQIKTDPDKFGTEGPRAKENAEWLIRLLHETAQSKKNYRGGKYTVGYYSMTSHAGFGALSKALPSGRKDKETFPSGITPVSWATRNCLDVYHFIAALPHTCIANGQALNLKYSPPLSNAPEVLEPYTKKFADEIESYFKLGEKKSGGLQVQFNLIDRGTLRDAQRHPDQYHELFVRVSGYSAYFRDLNPKMKEEIINRAEYDLDTGWIVCDTAQVAREDGQEAQSSNPKPFFQSLLNSLLFRGFVFSGGLVSSGFCRLGPKFILNNAVDRLLDHNLANEAAEEFLKVLLFCMDLAFKFDQNYRENIKNFSGTYLFRSKVKNDVGVLAKFEDEDLDWCEVTFDNGEMRLSFLRRLWERIKSLVGGKRKFSDRPPDATVVFKNGHALLNYLINYVIFDERDFLESVLNNEITPSGNMNYLYKFLFMANHPLLEVKNKLFH